jgi:hypothetical protein
MLEEERVREKIKVLNYNLKITLLLFILDHLVKNDETNGNIIFLNSRLGGEYVLLH